MDDGNNKMMISFHRVPEYNRNRYLNVMPARKRETKNRLSLDSQMTKEMKHGLGIALIIVFLSCTDKNDHLPPSDLSGRWVETVTHSDTLDFGSLDSLDIMALDRGKEIRDGALIPKYRSGPYVYRLTEGKISLRWLLSGNSEFEEYSFQIAGDRLYIGNFYDPALEESLTFEKLDGVTATCRLKNSGKMMGRLRQYDAILRLQEQLPIILMVSLSLNPRSFAWNTIRGLRNLVTPE